ncbi:MAG TPA: hypothetical protein PK718_05935 [Candidatus Methanofastidiosa archaeon]|nr:hypothetical protein [Candidatus Methanofastidiosa archaeon]
MADRSVKERMSLFIPGYYTYLSRGRTLKMLFGLYFLYTSCLPIMFIELFHIYHNGLEEYITGTLPMHVAVYLLFCFLFFLVYETGYIYNDVISEKMEKVDSGRLGSSIKRRYVPISTIFRLAVLAAFLLLAWQYTEWPYVEHFALFNIILIGVYYVHNNVVKAYRLPTIFYLRIYRVIYPVFYFLCADGVLTFPVLSYALVLSAYNVLTYLGVNPVEFRLEKDNLFERFYHNGRVRALFFMSNIALLNLFGVVMLGQRVGTSLSFTLLASAYVLATYVLTKGR